MIKLKNKKGQIGKFIETPFIILFIFVIMTSFIIASSVLSLGKPTNPDVLFSDTSFLIGNIEIDGENKLVLDAYLDFYLGKIKKEALDKALQELINKDGLCLVLVGEFDKKPFSNIGFGWTSPSAFFGSENFFIIENKEGVVVSWTGWTEILKIYRQLPHSTNSISFELEENGKKRNYFLEYYYGRCSEDA